MPRHGVSRDSLKGSIQDAYTHVQKMLPESTGAKFSPFSAWQEYPIVLKDGEEVDRFVKDCIRLYVSSWVLVPLERAMQKLNRKEMK